MAIRVVAGVKFEDKPRGGAVFVRESTRWQVIVDGIRAVDDALPRNAYRVHAGLMETYVMAEVRRREVLTDEMNGMEQTNFLEMLNADPARSTS